MYGTLEDWRTYATARGDTAPTEADDAVATAALVRASDYVEHQYVARLLPGYDDTLPVVEKATYIAASLELANPGFFSRTYTASERKVLTKVEGISWTVVGSGRGPEDAAPVSSLIEAMFAPYVYATRGPFYMLRSVG